jgi:hypothetical protein
MTVVDRAFMKPSYLTLGAAVLIFVSRVESFRTSRRGYFLRNVRRLCGGGD